MQLNVILVGTLVLLACVLPAAAAQGKNKESKPPKAPHVLFLTKLGNIEVELDPVHAPDTCKNFLSYVSRGLYDHGKFHRTVTMQNQPDKKVKIEVIQGGPNKDMEKATPVKLERTNKTGIKHVNGTISMARDKPDSATGDFFICIGDQPELDFGGKRNPDGQGFGAFGHVVSGMDVVKKIQLSKAKGQTLTPPVFITKATLSK